VRHFVGDNARIQGHTQVAVEHQAAGRDRLDQAHGQLGVIGQHGIDPHQQGVVLGAQPVGFDAALFRGDPFGVAGAGGDAAVQGLGGLEGYQRAFVKHKVAIAGVELGGFLLQDAREHFHTPGAQPVKALAIDQGVGVLHGGDDPDDAGLEDTFDAGAGAPLMAAGFEGHIEGGLFGLIAGLLDGVDLGMRPAQFLMPAFADDAAILDQQSADHRIGTDQAASLCRQFKGAGHIVLIKSGRAILRHSILSFIGHHAVYLRPAAAPPAARERPCLRA